MEWYMIILNVLVVLASIAMVVVVVLQKSDDDGVGALSGAKADGMRVNRGKGLEAKLPRITAILGVTLAVLCLAIVVIQRFVK